MSGYNDRLYYGGRKWLKTRVAPEPPVEWFVDDKNGDTLFRAKNEGHAKDIVAVMAIREPGRALVIRCYAPTPEQYEDDCQRMRDSRRWNSPSGGPAAPWPIPSSVALEPRHLFRAKKPKDSGNIFANKLYEALK